MTTSSIWHKLSNFLVRTSFYVVPLFMILIYYRDFEIGDNAYFYTLSTISQTLAALIGIVAIFVIFRLDMLKTKRSESFKSLATILQSDLAIGANQCHNTRYKVIRAVIEKVYIHHTVDDKIFNVLVSGIAESKSSESKLKSSSEKQMGELIENLEILMKCINKVNDHITNIHSKFADVTKFAFLAIMLSIFALPIDWTTLSTDTQIFKLYLVEAAVYLTMLSLFQTGLFIDDVINYND